MYKLIHEKTNREKRKLKIRSRLSGTAEKPRLTIFRSNRYIYAQLIDDVAGKTVFSAGGAVAVKKGVNKTNASFEIGKALAEKAMEKGIKTAVFDRNGYKYHGRVKSLADGARSAGLKI